MLVLVHTNCECVRTFCFRRNFNSIPAVGPGFRRGEMPTPNEGGANLLFFPENCMEMKEIGPGRGMPNFDLPVHTLRVEEILQKRVGVAVEIYFSGTFLNHELRYCLPEKMHYEILPLGSFTTRS